MGSVALSTLGAPWWWRRPHQAGAPGVGPHWPQEIGDSVSPKGLDRLPLCHIPEQAWVEQSRQAGWLWSGWGGEGATRQKGSPPIRAPTEGLL